MAGKNRANTLSAILSNMEDLEGAYESALNAEGSALKENENQLNSIEGRITLFNNALQTMWMNTLDSEAIKGLVDFGRILIEIIDKLGLLKTAFVAAFTVFSAKKNGFDLASIFGIHDEQDGWFSKLKQQGQEATQIISSLASVLKDTKNISFSVDLDDIGIGQQIDLLNKHYTEGQENFANYISSLGKTGDISNDAATALKAYAASVDDGSYSITGFNKFIAQHNAGIEASGIKAKAAAIGHQALNAALGFGISMIASFVIEGVIKGLNALIVTSEELKEEVTALTEEYENAKKSFSENLTTLTTSSDTSIYATLEDEFTRLTQGIDAYGNNISLTADQYERYKDICEQIVGIQPSIAAGYDSATQAIRNNANILSDLIELQKIEARNNAQEYIKNDNLTKIAQDAVNDYSTIYNDLYSKKVEFEGDLGMAPSTLVGTIDNWVNELEVAEQEVPSKVHDVYKKIQEAFYTDGIVDSEKVAGNVKLFESYLRELDAVGKDLYGEDFQFVDTSYLDKLDFSGAIDEIEILQADLEEASNGFVNSLLQIPASMSEYDELENADKFFINKWIQNSDMFKIDSTTTSDDILAYKSQIKKFIRDLAGEDYTTELENGTTVTASDIIDSILNFDTTSINWEKYKEEIQHLIDLLWQAIGGEGNTLGFEDKDALAISLGFDFKTTDENEEKMIKRYAEIKNITEEEARTYFNSLPPITVQRLITVDWNTVDENNVNSTINGASVENITSVKTYSDLTSSVENYNEVLSQTSEIVLDNTEVTQEYKDSLTELGISEEDLADCFDETNPLIVKNASLLNQLVKSSKSNIAQNARLAKSQAQLQYYDLYKQIRQLVNGQQVTNQATLNQINSLYAEMNALEKVIAKYSMLETKLLGVANAYTEFEKAQEIDSETDYIGSAEGMIQALGEAFNTAELGSETAQAAIKGLVPESVYEDLDTVDEKMAAIYKYFKEGKLSQYFDIQFDEDGNIESAVMKLGNLRKFIEDGLSGDANGDGINVFEGTDWQHFELSDEFMESIKDSKDPLQEFANQMDVTKEVAFAFFKAIEDHDIEWLKGDYSSLFDDLLSNNVEYAIYKNTSALADLEVQLANGEITAEEYAKKLAELTEASKANAQKARENATSWVDANNKVNAAKDEVERLTKELLILKEQGASDQEIRVKTSQLTAASKVLSDALQKKYNLEEPTEVTIQLALEDITAQIDQWKADNSELIVDVLPKLQQDENGKWTIPADVEATLDETEKTKIQEYLGLLNDQYTINVLADENATDSTSELEAVKTAAEAAQEAIDNIENPTIDTTNAQKELKVLADTINSLPSAVIKISTVVTEPTTTGGSNAPKASAVGSNAKLRQNTMFVNGTAHASGNWGLPADEHDSLVGELGPEMVVDPQSGRYYTVGDQGAEFVDLKRGSIIFNHKQTEGLLKNGYITSRGKAYAEGNAHVTIWSDGSSKSQWEGTGYSGPYDPTWDAADALNNAASSLSDAADSADEFNEIFDWVEVRLEEIEEQLSLFSASLENATTYVDKNNIIDNMMELNQTKLANLKAGYEEYSEYASELLTKVPEKYREAAQNGAIAIEKFVGEADEVTLEAINNYREWAQKAADLKQQAEEVITIMRELAIQKISNVYEAQDARVQVEDSQTSKLQARVDYLETSGVIPSDVYYGTNAGQAEGSTGMFENSYKKIEYWQEALIGMQEKFNEAVREGQLEVGSNEWYKQIKELYGVQANIDAAKLEIEEFQNASNDLYWDNFDELISRTEYLESETQGLIDLMSHEDMVAEPTKKTYENGTVEYWTADDVKWTEEGLASLGLHAQKMEMAEFKAKQYAEAIDDLTADYEKGLYSENEYLKKLNELTEGQKDAIDSYYDEQDAIVDLNETRIDSIKSGIEAEIDAYSELIEKKKKALDSEKDLYDFQKQASESSKNIAQLERQLMALANDTSMSSMAKRKQLEQELAEARAEQEELYYNRSIEDQQSALDQELEIFQQEKDAEIAKLDEYLTNVELVIADSLNLIQANASGIYDTLTGKAEEYNLTLSDYVMSPWQDGALAVSDYQSTFDTAMSSTTDQLEALKNKWQEVIDKMNEAARIDLDNINTENAKYAGAREKTPDPPANNNQNNNQQQSQEKAITVGGKIDASGAKIYSYAGGSGYNQYYSNDPVYTVLAENGDWIQVRHHKLSSGVTGWFKKGTVKAYAKGTTKLEKSGIVNIDELGEELILRAQNGRLTYMEKGSGVIPADLTSNLMAWGALDPQDILDRNRPAITAPHIVNNEMSINMNIAEVVHIDEVTNDTIPDLTKAVQKQMDSYMTKLNNAIKAKVR